MALNKERDRDPHYHQKERGGEKKMLVGVIWNCAPELKLILAALLILCSVATLLQFLPPRFPISTSDIRRCISKISNGTDPNTNINIPSRLQVQQQQQQQQQSSPPPYPAPPPPPPPPAVEHDQILNNSVLKRAFNAYGAAAYNFITMGSYRGGFDTFAIIGLSSKPLHVYGKPAYQCEWVPQNDTKKSTFAKLTYKMLPDWGYGRVYTVVIVNCTFAEPVNDDNSGGTLYLHASTAGGGDVNFNLTDVVFALEEKPGSVDFSLYKSYEPKYDYFYCGSPLYGGLSPQRVREWIAYHVRFFGEKSHFVIYNAGGVHEEVFQVLKPWMDLGYVTLHDITEQERFDGYYHNQFLVVNDCLHRYKFLAKWMFFFDVDEYIYVPPKNNIKPVLDSLMDYNQFTIEQMHMNNQLCFSGDSGKTNRKWGFEKLVYKDIKRGIRRDRKYAIQPRNVYATGVHMSQNLQGRTNHKTEGKIKYYHYHGTIAQRTEPCSTFINWTRYNFENTPYMLDATMRSVAGAVKKFELEKIGNRLQQTRQ